MEGLQPSRKTLPDLPLPTSLRYPGLFCGSLNASYLCLHTFPALFQRAFLPTLTANLLVGRQAAVFPGLAASVGMKDWFEVAAVAVCMCVDPLGFTGSLLGPHTGHGSHSELHPRRLCSEDAYARTEMPVVLGDPVPAGLTLVWVLSSCPISWPWLT